MGWPSNVCNDVTMERDGWHLAADIPQEPVITSHCCAPVEMDCGSHIPLLPSCITESNQSHIIRACNDRLKHETNRAKGERDRVVKAIHD